jgi:hypothetical protein
MASTRAPIVTVKHVEVTLDLDHEAQNVGLNAQANRRARGHQVCRVCGYPVLIVRE